MIKISNKKNIEFQLTLKTLIGFEVKIINSTIKNQIGLFGTIVFESNNFIFIKIKEEIKKIKKDNLILQFNYNNNLIHFNCNSIIGNLPTRIKKIK